MWIDNNMVTIWALVWLLLSLVLFLSLRTKSYSGVVVQTVERLNRYAVLAVLVIAFLVRIVPALMLPVGARYDIISFELVGEALLAQEDVYTSAAMGRHPYLPMQMYLIGAIFFVAKQIAIPFVVLIKSLSILADVMITAVIITSAKRWQRPKTEVLFLGLLYALNPVSILVSAYHGQFDPITVLLLLLAWFAYEINQKVNKSAIYLGFAVLNKTWPIVLLPIIFIRLATLKKQIYYVAITLAIPFVMTIGYMVFFQANPMSMLGSIFGYAGNTGHWGWSAILASIGLKLSTIQTFYEFLLSIQKVILIVVGIASLWLTRKQSTLNALTTIILCIFSVTAGFGIQWLLWVVPFGILTGDLGWSKWYAVTGMLLIIAQLYGWHMHPWVHKWIHPRAKGDMFVWLSSIPVWIVTLSWSFTRVKQAILIPQAQIK